MGVGSILFHPAIPEIFYFQHNVGASNMLQISIICIANPDVDSLSIVSDAIPLLTLSTAAIRLLQWVVSLRTNQFDIVNSTDPRW